MIVLNHHHHHLHVPTPAPALSPLLSPQVSSQPLVTLASSGHLGWNKWDVINTCILKICFFIGCSLAGGSWQVAVGRWQLAGGS